MPIDIPGFAYAAAVAAGGIMGYVKSSKYIFQSVSYQFTQYKYTNNPRKIVIACLTRLGCFYCDIALLRAVEY